MRDDIFEGTAEAPVVASRPVLGLLTAGVLVAVALATGVSSFELGFWTDLGPGAGFFPLCLAVALGVLSAAWGWRQWREAAQEPDAGVVAPELDHQPLEVPANLGHIVAILGSLVVVALVLEVLGFQLSMFLFLVFHLRVLGRRRWPLTLVLSLVGSVGLFVAFTRLFSVVLPASSIPVLTSMGF